VGNSSVPQLEYTEKEAQEYRIGTRDDFVQKCKSGTYDVVVAIFRSNESTTVSTMDDEISVDISSDLATGDRSI
jgi:hypothetical protein